MSAATAPSAIVEPAPTPALADACGQLLRDGAERSMLAASALRLVEERFTWERQVDALLGIYGID